MGIGTRQWIVDHPSRAIVHGNLAFEASASNPNWEDMVPSNSCPHPPDVSTLIFRLSPVDRQSEAVPFSLHASGSQATGYKADDASSTLAASEWPR